MQSFIISHSSCAEQYGDMSADAQIHSLTHTGCWPTSWPYQYNIQYIIIVGPLLPIRYDNGGRLGIAMYIKISNSPCS